MAGATGYVLKERDDIEVALSIRSILRGGAPIDPFIARQILNNFLYLMSKLRKNIENEIDDALLSNVNMKYYYWLPKV
jgi:DNA-binding NarL/FixJ family response regulator